LDVSLAPLDYLIYSIYIKPIRGNFIVMAGTTMAIVGLTFGGVRFPWNSVQVLVPLILGFALIVVFVFYEGRVPSVPTMPWDILRNRTTVAA
jgi:hypothetical protein